MPLSVSDLPEIGAEQEAKPTSVVLSIDHSSSVGSSYEGSKPMVDEDAGGTLARSLISAVSDPGQLQELYAILGDFCHLFRNRLNSLKLSIYLAKRGGPLPGNVGWADLERDYQQAEQLMEQLQIVCRPAPVSSMRLPLGMLLDDRRPVWSEWLAARGRRLDLEGPRKPAIGDYDPARLAQGLDALAAWRSEAGEPGTAVLVRWRAESDQLQMEWEEPNAKSPGRGKEESSAASLALPLLARVMADHRGSLALAPGSGLRLRLQWPLAAR